MRRPVARSERQRLLLNELDSIRKRYGDEAVTVYGVDEKRDEQAGKIEVLSTGIISVDRATGIGGIPRGRITEIYGTESSGKTTLTLHVIAEVQKQGGIAAFVDAEHALDPLFAARLGIGTDALLVSKPDTGEESLGIVEILVRSGVIDIIVVDSVAALVPQAEIQGEKGDFHKGLPATLMSKALKRLVGFVRKSKSAVIFINQLRMKWGVMTGNPETTPAGHALQFYASLRIDLRIIRTVMDESEAYANEIKATIVKNKVGESRGEATFHIWYDPAKTLAANAFEVGVELGIIVKNGNWYTYAGEKLGTNLCNAVETLINSPLIYDHIRNACK